MYFYYFFLLCLPASNIRPAAATAAFRDSASPSIGIRMRQSAQSATSSRSPFPSFPIKNAPSGRCHGQIPAGAGVSRRCPQACPPDGG